MTRAKESTESLDDLVQHVLHDVMAIARNKHRPIAARLSAIRAALRLGYADLEELARLVPDYVARSESTKPKTIAKADRRRTRLQFEIIQLRRMIETRALEQPRRRPRLTRMTVGTIAALCLKNPGAAIADALSRGPVNSAPGSGGSRTKDRTTSRFGSIFS